MGREHIAGKDAGDSGEDGLIRGFVMEHPLFAMLLAGVCTLLLVGGGGWIYLHVTTDDNISAELRALGLPQNGAELNHWNHPKDDGGKEFQEAMQMMDALRTRLGNTFDEITDTEKLKPEELEKHKKELEDLSKDLQPIREKMDEANRHNALTYHVDYTDFLTTPIGAVVAHRSFLLALRSVALYECHVKKNPSKALRILIPAFQTTHKLHTYTIIENLFSIASDGIAVSAVSDVLDCAAPEPELLRSISSMLLSPAAQKNAADRLALSFAGEVVFVREAIGHSGIRKILNGDFGRYAILGKIYLVALGDLKYRACMDDMIRTYLLALQSYPESKVALDQMREIPKGMTRCHTSTGYYINIWDGISLATQCRFIDSHYNGEAGTLELGIACALAAERLEGKPWPENLDDARWPRDPFTGLPFKLIVTKDAIFIYSLGPDQKDSGKVEIFNRTGNMESVPTSTKIEDDVVFRLSRIPYDKASAGSKN